MDLPSLNRRLLEALIPFSWDEWAQMGVPATPGRRGPWAQDPEALLVFTLEVARDEPRLFDEVLDWLVTNEGLISVRRLRAMSIDDTDRALTDAALTWLARQRPRARLRGGASARRSSRSATEPLFRLGGTVTDPDEDFAAAGFARPRLLRSGRTGPPDPLAPINLAYRLRQILGVGVRAEVVRLLLTTGAPRLTAQTLARSTGYAKRNVHEALAGLTAAGVVSALTVGSERRYAAVRTAWAALLGQNTEGLPVYREWPQLFAVLRRILRFSRQPELEDLSDYLRASRARDLLESVRPDLAFAGIPVGFTPSLEGAWRDLDEVVDEVMTVLRVAPRASA